MNPAQQYDKKRKFIQQQQDDDEQIERTLKYFDSILDEYLYDNDISDENTIQKSYSQTRFVNDVPVQLMKQNGHGIKFTPKTTSSISTSEESNYIHTPRSHQSNNHNNHHHSKHIESNISNDRSNNFRRHTSENNLNQIVSTTKPVKEEKSSRPHYLQTTATSTEDLLSVPSSRNYPVNDRLSVLIDRTNHLVSNNISASLIDLTAIDKVSSRPRFRFVPPSNENLTLTEEQNNKPQSNQNIEQYHLKTIKHEQTSLSSQNKYSHNIVKPTVIIPSTPKSAPINQLTESAIHYENGKSAFKPHRSSKIDHSSKDQHPPLSPSRKRTDPINKPSMNVGIASQSNQLLDPNVVLRQKHSMPQFHQSIPNLSPQGASEKVNGNMYASHISDQPGSMNFIKLAPYTPPSNKSNGYQSYQLPPGSQDSIVRWIQQVNNSSSISGLVHPSYNPPFTNGGAYRPLQPSYPYGPYVPMNSSVSQSVNVPDPNHRHHHQQQPPIYVNHGSVQRYISVPQSTPIQSSQISSSPALRNGNFPLPSNVYHFHRNNISRDGQSKHNSNRQSMHVASYL